MEATISVVLVDGLINNYRRFLIGMDLQKSMEFPKDVIDVIEDIGAELSNPDGRVRLGQYIDLEKVIASHVDKSFF